MMFQKIKRFFDMGLYGSAEVAAFVEHGKLTAEQYEQIVGSVYPYGVASE